MKRKKARTVVDAVMNTIWQRRPFKHDLAKMRELGQTETDREEGRGGPLWEEMMVVMEDAVMKAVG